MKLSVIIPTKDRDELLLQAVGSVATQTRRLDELIVVDDGRIAESTQVKIRSSCEQLGVVFQYLRKDKPGLAESKNLGIAAATGDVIVTLDDDIILESDYLEQLVATWQEHWTDESLAGIGGVFKEARPVGRFERMFDRLFLLRPQDPRRSWSILPWAFHTFNYSLAGIEDADWLPGGNSSLRMTIARQFAFSALQPGRTSLEDIDYGWRLKKAGYRMLMNGRVRMLHLESPVGRERALLAGFKEGANRRIIFDRFADKTFVNRLRFTWAAVGSVLKKLLAAGVNRERRGVYLRQAWGLARGYLSTKPPDKR